MEDYFEDFDDFGENGFTDDDSFEDSLEGEMDEPFTDDTELDVDDEPIEAESQDDDFTAKDAFLAGFFASWAYEKGFEEGRRKRFLKVQSKRRKRKKFSDNSD